jgi:3-deoxy-D-manno-octulosonic-acid transferase
LPLVVLRLWWLGRYDHRYRRGWKQRFGYVRLPAGSKDWIWIHAVSVGEVQAATPLVKVLRQRYPQFNVLLTTTTPTGADTVRRQLGGQAEHGYLPYDLPCAVTRFLARVRPRFAVIMETELWPNLLYACAAQGVPVWLANARLSARSLGRYQYLPGFAREMVKRISCIAAQTQEDAQRFLALGAEPASVVVTGNLKFDAVVPPDIHVRGQELRVALGVDRPVWIAASTHEGEEELMLAAHARLLKQFPRALLVLVPRHPGRFQAVYELCGRLGYRVFKRTSGGPCTADTAVFLVDTMGELLAFYAAADIAFVGGSLVPVGGHNPLEPASVGRPVIAGPYVFNFTEIYRQLEAADAVTVTKNVEALHLALAASLSDPGQARARGARACGVIEQHKGALATLLTLLSQTLKDFNRDL